MKKIFLGGTCGQSDWRENAVIPGLLRRGVSEYAVYNPVIIGRPWTEEDQQQENRVKGAEDTLLLFVLGNPYPWRVDVTDGSFYSGVEVTIEAFANPERLVVMLDTKGLASALVSSINASVKEWMRIAPGLQVFWDYDALLDHLAARLKEE